MFDEDTCFQCFVLIQRNIIKYIHRQKKCPSLDISTNIKFCKIYTTQWGCAEEGIELRNYFSCVIIFKELPLEKRQN